MPKYYDYKVAGYYLYFTSHCVIEGMRVHASDRKLTEYGSTKLFVKSNVFKMGSVQQRRILREIDNALASGKS